MRRLAIYNNYRALVDVNANGDYGSLYGPNIDAAGASTLGEGRIAGTEYLAYADDGSGAGNVTMMVQVPSAFDPGMFASHYAFATPAIVMTYANTYGRFGVTDNLCGFSFAATDATGKPPRRRSPTPTFRQSRMRPAMRKGSPSATIP